MNIKRRNIRERIAYKILENNHLKKEDLVHIFIMENFKMESSRRKMLISRQRKNFEGKHGYQEEKNNYWQKNESYLIKERNEAAR